ncbi:hypothetical protein EVB39_018 [Rhizobium phage RHph_TM3_3_9]|nr:hypothetical protein EVB39_018 [Rhizobium phage RHph_TM3_3_9]QIG67820.1 hypothetical protein EVB53_018 [Rhizobium phage RHph_Y60]QIG68539.1 hypothetical protein EVB66_018 [Rhizobium phage RHph_TM3_3_13]QIG74397.1 hypothetical protein EVC09_017 [Rhizobium phage RHph_TM3_3_10]QXV74510.1 hypothetical protein [Rhizobium phage RHEph19]
MIDAPVYKHSVGHIKIKLLATMLDKGWPTNACVELANDCVAAGETTPYWREQMGDEAADALNNDLKGMMQ